MVEKGRTCLPDTSLHVSRLLVAVGGGGVSEAEVGATAGVRGPVLQRSVPGVQGHQALDGAMAALVV